MMVNKDEASQSGEKKKDGQRSFKWHRISALRVWHTVNPISFIAASSKSIKSISKEEIR